MTNIELVALLEQAYEKTFLDAIEFLFDQSSEYKRSKFYKTTRIPLEILFEKYFTWQKASYNMVDDLFESIMSVDTNRLVEKISDIVEKASQDGKISEFFTKLLEQFDPEVLEKYSQEFDKTVQSLKN
jgi:hypothetical protein